MDIISSYEINILLFIQEHIRNFILTPPMIFVTTLNNLGILAIVTCILLLIIKKTRQLGFVSSASLLITTLIVNVVLKPSVARIRPYDAYPALNALVPPLKDYSFPSGHASAAFAVATVIYLIAPKKYGIPAIILSVLISFSRLYLGVHYPTDVLVGALTGILSGILCAKLYKRYINNKAASKTCE